MSLSKDMMLIDGSNIGHIAAASPVLKAGEVETHVTLGFLRMLRAAQARFPTYKPIVLWDGASWRKSLLVAYKRSRGEKPTTVSEENVARVRNSFKAQRSTVMRALALIEVAQMHALNLEADDLAGMLVKRYADKGGRILMISGDKDWITLVGPKVGWMNPVPSKGQFRSVTHLNFEEEMGVKNGRAWLECKALMGDPSDEIPGVGGIGEKGAKDLINIYGSVACFFNTSMLDKDLPKKYIALADSAEKHDIYHRNIQLMDLQHESIPKPLKLRLIKGRFDIEAFKTFCRRQMYQSLLTDTEKWLEPFRRNHEVY